MPFSRQQQGWGERIRARRLELGISQRELARRAGVDPGNLAKVEAGKAGTSDATRERIAGALGVRVPDVWAYPDTREVS